MKERDIFSGELKQYFWNVTCRTSIATRAALTVIYLALPGPWQSEGVEILRVGWKKRGGNTRVHRALHPRSYMNSREWNFTKILEACRSRHRRALITRVPFFTLLYFTRSVFYVRSLIKAAWMKRCCCCTVLSVELFSLSDSSKNIYDARAFF